MPKKSALRILITAGLLAVVLLSVKGLSSESAPETNSAAIPANYYSGSDWIERHPPTPFPANYYAGSDWIERHPPTPVPENYYNGSDWIERHPCQPTP